MIGTALVLSTAAPLITIHAVQAQAIFTVPSNQALSVIDNLQINTRKFRRSFNQAVNQTSLNNTEREDVLNTFLADFEKSTYQLERQYKSGSQTLDDVRMILTKGSRLDRIMPRSGNIWNEANQDWAQLRRSLGNLAQITRGTQFPVASVNGNSAIFSVPSNQVYPVLGNLQYNSFQFRRSFNQTLNQSRLNNTQREDVLRNYVAEFDRSVNQLQRQYAYGAQTADDVKDVLNRGSRIDQLLPRNGDIWVNTNRDWANLRRSLQDLARITRGTQFPTQVSINNPSNNSIFLVPSNQVYPVVTGLQGNSRTFRNSVNKALDASRFNPLGRDNTIKEYLVSFERSVNLLEKQYASGQPTADDVRSVLTQGSRIDQYMPRNGVVWAQANQDWARLRQNLQDLARITRGTQFPVR